MYIYSHEILENYYHAYYINEFQEAMNRESEAQAETYATKDFLEGVTATKEKRAPTFKAM